MSVITLPATDKTSMSARINGQSFNYDNHCGFAWWKEGDSETIVDMGVQEWTFYYDLEGLDEDARYYFYAFEYEGVTGDTLSFYTFTETLGGTLRFGGTIDANPIHIPVINYKNIAGSLFLRGGLTKQVNKQLGGTLGFSGALSIIEPAETKDVAGSLSLSGELTTVGVTETKDDLGGILSFGGALEVSSVAMLDTTGSLRLSGALTKTLLHATPTGARNVAATKSLYMEQGTTFVKVFEWRDSSGVAKDLSNYTLRGALRAYKGATSAITTSATTFIITKLAGTGQFQVSMTAAVTAAFTFTRAFYDIEAVYGPQVFRLVEGIVYLSKEVTTNAT